MKRRLLLLIGSLAAILVVFVIGLWVVGLGEGRPEAVPPAPEAVAPSRAPTSGEAMAPQEGTDFRAVTRDKEGRLKRLFTAPYYENKGQGVYVLNEPKAVIYQSDGQQIQISAERGTIYSESRRTDEGAIRLTVKQGQLQGHVTVYFDRATDPDRPPVEQRTSDPNVLIASADNIHFDNERLLLYTNDRVRVTSQQVEMSGRGLSVRWNEDPQELQVLRLEQGDGMVIRYVPGEEVEFLALPGGGKLSAVPGQGEEAGQDETEPAPPMPLEGIDETVNKPIDEAPAPPPPIQEAAEHQPKPPSRHKARNIYTAEFRGDVRVVQGDRYVHGADKLALEFQWASSRRDEDRAEPPARVTPGELIISPGSATEPAAEAPAKVEAPASVEAPATVESSTAPASQPMGEPITITWTGPLEIVPTGYTENPSRKNVAVSGQGTTITLFDGNTTALCHQFEFRRKADPAGDRRQGRLTGTADCPALLALANGEEIVCRSMQFELSPTGDTARLEGEGYIARPAEGERSPVDLAAAERGREGQTPPGDFECISWKNSVDVMLARDESVRGQVYIRQAHFRGDVELSSSDRGEGLRCDKLNVGVERRKANERSGLRTSVRSVLAEGNVTVRGGQGEGKWRAFAARLWGDPAEGMAMLSGDPARLTSRNSTLSGKEIHFRAFKDVDGSFIRGAGMARVAGEGELRMPVDKDLSGTQLTTPRLATITWAQEMRYIDYGRSTLGPREGQEGAPAMASFSGQVHLTSGNEEMTCEEMRATFVGPAAPAGPAEKPSAEVPKSDSRSLNLGTINYGGSLWKVYAYQDVVLKSHRRDRQGRMLGLVELRTNSLVYDAVAKIADADDGWLLVQDIRPPVETQEKPPGGAEAGSSDRSPAGDLESPSQTYFEWSKAMHLGMETRLVQLTGDVWMRHAGGDQIVERDALKEKWNIQDWPDPLPAGRLSDLRCNSLLAQFAPPTPSGGAKPSPAATEPNTASEDELRAGLNIIGPLDLFVAKGAVLLKDDPWEVVGEKLTYERKQDVITVLGSADGKGQTNARISRMEQDRVVTNESPWVRWYRKNRTRKDDRVETGPMTGSGVILPSSKGR
jgi:lipopolysaccharide export system protein LptA/lipopolysaccharide export system protein LptC